MSNNSPLQRRGMARLKAQPVVSAFPVRERGGRLSARELRRFQHRALLFAAGIASGSDLVGRAASHQLAGLRLPLNERLCSNALITPSERENAMRGCSKKASTISRASVPGRFRAAHRAEMGEPVRLLGQSLSLKERPAIKQGAYCNFTSFRSI